MSKPKLQALTDKFSLGDILGGLAASAVVLPQAMAFGVTLLVPHGFDASKGALAGLLATAFVCFGSGIMGGTRGMISAPTGPTLVLLTGSLAVLSKAGISGNDLIINLAAVIFFTGLLQILIGLTGSGKLIKYIPYPVISGFLTGSAILMVLSQTTPLSGKGAGDAWESWSWLPLATALITLLATIFAPKFISRLPGTIAGLLFGTIFFQLAVFIHGFEAPSQWLVGQLPSFDGARLDIHYGLVHVLNWQIIIPAAMALSIMTSLDTLLTAVIADVTTGTRHRANLEMTGQGIGQLVSSLAGGMAAAGTTGATVVSVKTGGRRWAGVFAGITFLFLLLVARDVGSVLPISVLAGIILAVSLHLVDLDILVWIKSKSTRIDAIVAVIVTLVTVAYNLMVAVGIGVLIAIIMFIRAQVKTPVVHRRSTGQEVRSIRYRRSKERELLEQNGWRIILYELRSNLFFATADILFDELSGDLDEPNYIILHLQRVQYVDLTAKKYLQQIAERLNKNGGHLIFCNVHKGIGISKRVQKTFRKVNRFDLGFHVLTFNDTDEALEHAENALLNELGVAPTNFSDQVSLRDNELCKELSIEDETKLGRFLETRILEKKEMLFKAGDFGNAAYMVITGEIEIRLPTTRHHYKRLATCHPGSVFGEMSLLYPGPRAADAIATQVSRIYTLDSDRLEQLRKQYPETSANLLMTLARIQAEHLRWSAKEIQHLLEW